MALLHYFRLIYLNTFAVSASTSTHANKLKLITAIIAFLTYKYRSHAIGTRRRNDLKEPKGAVPFLGHTLLMASIPGTELLDAFFLKNYRELGPVWSISLPGIGRMIQGDTPEMVEHVNKANFAAYEKGEHFNSALHDIVGKGIICSDGEEWKSQRKVTAQILSAKAIREHSNEGLNREVQKILDYFEKAAASGSEVDFHELMHAFSLDAFGSWTFGESFGCLEDIGRKVPFAEALNELLEISSGRLNDPIWKLRESITPVGTNVRQNKAVMRQHIHRMIAKHREQDWSDPNKKRNLLMMYMETKGVDGQPYSDELLADSMMTLLVAGRDTTSEAMSWMIYLLHREEADPSILKMVLAEIDDVLGDNPPTHETHKKLKFVEACLYETLRLFPTLPRNLRRCIKDDILPDGTKIYAGDYFTWSYYAMGRSERIWGPEVETFKPSRWLAGERSASMNKFNPFHLGPRQCVGQGFAIVQAVTTMALLLKNFEVTLVEPGKLPVYGVGITLPMACGLPIRVARRT